MDLIWLRCTAFSRTVIRFDLAGLCGEDPARRAGTSRHAILRRGGGNHFGGIVPGFTGQQSTKRAHLSEGHLHLGCGNSRVCPQRTVLDFHDRASRLRNWSDTSRNDNDYIVANPRADANERTRDEPEHAAHHGHSTSRRFPGRSLDCGNRSPGNGLTECQLGGDLRTTARDAARGTFNLAWNSTFQYGDVVFEIAETGILEVCSSPHHLFGWRQLFVLHRDCMSGPE